MLIDDDRLAALVTRYNVGVGCRIEETVHIKKTDEEFFID